MKLEVIIDVLFLVVIYLAIITLNLELFYL